ncbi:hypothetical protein [Parasediminibacterium sp. JCM 36343]
MGLSLTHNMTTVQSNTEKSGRKTGLEKPYGTRPNPQNDHDLQQ